MRPRTVKHFADSVLELKFPMDNPRVHLAIERTVIISIIFVFARKVNGKKLLKHRKSL